MTRPPVPLLTAPVHEALRAARATAPARIECSLDLGRSTSTVDVGASVWTWNGQAYPFPEVCKERTVYYWAGEAFAPVARFGAALIKLVPTQWGAPTFEIDGIKMLPTAQVSPYADAERKVGLIQPRGKVILDTCGGLGYFAAWCLRGGARRIDAYEKNPDVIWLRTLNPWSPEYSGLQGSGSQATGAQNDAGALTLRNADIAEQIATLPDASYDAALHDPPRFGIAGELYSQTFYGHLARVLKPKGLLFHYTGTPNRLTSRRDVPNEVATRLQRAGFSTELIGDGVLARKLRY